MDTDKEPLESHQKIAMFPPTLSSKPSAQPTIDSSAQNAGYQQSLSAKGKLILPTALWILLVVAGLCFISLLSSLNKTLGTLDTLVELEQENARLNKAHDHHKDRLKSGASTVEMLESRLPIINEEILGSGSAKKPDFGSWFKSPRLIPLESNEPHNLGRGSTKDIGVESLIDNILNSVSGANGGMIPSAGTIIVSSGSSSDGPELGGNPIESMLNKMLDSTNNHQAYGETIPQKGASPSLVTANIDKINININSQPSDNKKQEQTLQKSKSEEPSLEEEMNSLGESIDSLMSKLKPTPFNDVRPPNNYMFPPPEPMISEPFGRPAKHHASHQHRHRQHKQSLPSDSMIPMTRLFTPMNLAEDSNAPSLVEQPQNSNILIALNKEFTNNVKDDVPSTRRPKFSPLGQANNSPYEFIASDIIQPKQSTDESIEQASDELGKLLAQSLFQTLYSEHPPTTNSPIPSLKNYSGESIVLIDGRPLISDKKQSLASDESHANPREDPRNQWSELFQTFFGPPPSSQFMIPAEIVTTSAPMLSPGVNQNESPKETIQRGIFDANPVVLENANLTYEEGTTTTSRPSSVPNEIEQFADQILGSMFALPQMANDQNPTRVNPGAGDFQSFPIFPVEPESTNNDFTRPW